MERVRALRKFRFHRPKNLSLHPENLPRKEYRDGFFQPS